MFSKAKSGADKFFASHITASAAVALLWVAYLHPLPHLLSGLAAGMILASSTIMFLHRTRDEYTLAIWHAGTAAGFATIVIWLVASSFAPILDLHRATASSLPVLTAMTAYLVVIGVKWVGARA